MDNIKSGYIAFNNWNAYFDVFGSGPQPVIMIPGSIGTALTDYSQQLFGEYALDFKRFTLVVVELPGWGRSRPPQRVFDEFYFERDIDCCHQVMQHLGHNEYSVIGWSHGARVALLMAAKYSQHITSLVLTGLSNRNNDNLIQWGKSSQTTDSSNIKFIQRYLRSYESVIEIQDFFKSGAQFYIESMPRIFGQDLFQYKYDLVKCPVLIFHGDQDPFSDTNEVIAISERLSDCRLHRITNARHDLNIRFDKIFNTMSEEFILNNKRQ